MLDPIRLSFALVPFRLCSDHNFSGPNQKFSSYINPIIVLAWNDLATFCAHSAENLSDQKFKFPLVHITGVNFGKSRIDQLLTKLVEEEISLITSFLRCRQRQRVSYLRHKLTRMRRSLSDFHSRPKTGSNKIPRKWFLPI